jgi:hypothetical protein
MHMKIMEITQELLRLEPSEEVQVRDQLATAIVNRLDRTDASLTGDEGAEFARFADCLTAASANPMTAWRIAREKFGDEHPLTQLMRAAIFRGGVSRG